MKKLSWEQLEIEAQKFCDEAGLTNEDWDEGGGYLTTSVAEALKQSYKQGKKCVAYELFEEFICPMCYRLNPQHATMDNGAGCHYCQDREDWNALKENTQK